MCLCRSRRNHPILPCLSRALLECCLSENTVYHNMIVYYWIIVWPRSLCRFSLGSSFSPASQFRFHSLYTRSTRLIKKIFHFPSVMRSQRGADEKKRSWPLTSDIPYIFLCTPVRCFYSHTCYLRVTKWHFHHQPDLRPEEEEEERDKEKRGGASHRFPAYFTCIALARTVLRDQP